MMSHLQPLLFFPGLVKQKKLGLVDYAGGNAEVGWEGTTNRSAGDASGDRKYVGAVQHGGLKVASCSGIHRRQ